PRWRRTPSRHRPFESVPVVRRTDGEDDRIDTRSADRQRSRAFVSGGGANHQSAVPRRQFSSPFGVQPLHTHQVGFIGGVYVQSLRLVPTSRRITGKVGPVTLVIVGILSISHQIG